MGFVSAKVSDVADIREFECALPDDVLSFAADVEKVLLTAALAAMGAAATSAQMSRSHGRQPDLAFAILPRWPIRSRAPSLDCTGTLDTALWQHHGHRRLEVNDRRHCGCGGAVTCRQGARGGREVDEAGKCGDGSERARIGAAQRQADIGDHGKLPAGDGRRWLCRAESIHRGLG
jgi:hypothetical protein